MLGGCVTHAGRSAFRGPRKAPREVWTATATTFAPAPSIGADDTVYVPAENAGIAAFSPDGGARRLDVGGGDVTGTPTIGSDGTLHVGAGSFAVAQRPDGGNLRFAMSDNIDSSPVIDAFGNVYFGSNADKLVSLDSTGAFRWERDTRGDIRSSPAIGPNGNIYVGSKSDSLFAFGNDGTALWEYPTGADVESSPVVADDGTIYVGSKNSKLHAVLPTGTARWVFDAPGNFEWQVLPAIALDGTIYVPAGSMLVALRPDKTSRWMFDAKVTLRTAVVVDADGIVYVGGDSSQLFALSPDDGTPLWSVDVGDTPRGFAIGRDGTIYLTCNNDKVRAFRE